MEAIKETQAQGHVEEVLHGHQNGSGGVSELRGGENPQAIRAVPSLERGEALEKREYHDVPATPENREKVEKAIRALSIYSKNHPETRFQYNVHEESGAIQVQLLNYKTGEVIEEVPSSKLLEMSAQMEELTGLVLEKRA